MEYNLFSRDFGKFVFERNPLFCSCSDLIPARPSPQAIRNSRQDRSGILAYERYDGRNRLLIITSALPKEAILSFAETDEEAVQMVEEVLLNNYEEPPSFKRELIIRPWECLVLKLGSVKEREGQRRSEA